MAGERLKFHAVARFHGLRRVFDDLILGLAPQALCLRLLRRLSDFLCKAPRVKEMRPAIRRWGALYRPLPLRRAAPQQQRTILLVRIT